MHVLEAPSRKNCDGNQRHMKFMGACTRVTLAKVIEFSQQKNHSLKHDPTLPVRHIILGI